MAATAAVFAGIAAAQTKVAVINIQSAVLQTAEIKKVSADLEAKYKPKQAEMEKLRTDIAGIQQKLQAGQGKLTPQQEQFMAATRPKEELYDLQNDPDELHNLADDRTLQSVLREHSRKLDDWIKSTKDQGEEPEDSQALASWQDDMAKSYLEEMTRRNLAPGISDEEYLKWWEKKLLGQEQPA
jgi:Skp family chaperone for outer membrane proteins